MSDGLHRGSQVMSNQANVRAGISARRPAQFGTTSCLFLISFVIVVTAEAIGNVKIPLGSSSIVLLPLLWALLLGASLGLAGPFLPAPLRLSRSTQSLSAAFLQPALLIFVAKLGLLVGGSIPKILASGWSLAFQEFGHFFGTMVFGLPVAILLGIKREAIGATFSVGREPSLAIIGEKFGMDSPEGRGVLAEYLTGTVFGAVFIAILASIIASSGLFHPLALAMAAGVGSGSMMAAAAGAIAAQQTPEMAKEVATFAAASNLITTTIGTYFTLFLSLPFTIWAYGKLEPVLGRFSAARQSPALVADAPALNEEIHPLGPVALVTGLLFIGAYGLIGNWLTYGTPIDTQAATGLAIILIPVFIGYALYVLTRRVLPAVIWVSLIGMLMTFPGMPHAQEISALTGKINFLALATPILAFAGLSLAKDVPAFRRLGWRIVDRVPDGEHWNLHRSGADRAVLDARAGLNPVSRLCPTENSMSIDSDMVAGRQDLHACCPVGGTGCPTARHAGRDRVRIWLDSADRSPEPVRDCGHDRRRGWLPTHSFKQHRRMVQHRPTVDHRPCLVARPECLPISFRARASTLSRKVLR